MKGKFPFVLLAEINIKYIRKSANCAILELSKQIQAHWRCYNNTWLSYLLRVRLTLNALLNQIKVTVNLTYFLEIGALAGASKWFCHILLLLDRTLGRASRLAPFVLQTWMISEIVLFIEERCVITFTPGGWKMHRYLEKSQREIQHPIRYIATP